MIPIKTRFIILAVPGFFLQCDHNGEPYKFDSREEAEKEAEECMETEYVIGEMTK